MPKKVTVSLKGIVKEIDAVTGKLSDLKGKAITSQEKQRLAANIEGLKKIRAEVRERCPKSGRLAYGVVVNVN
ncbi:MAG: hypothetical protein WBL63_21525 [Candidatus Acidiferrum sp.]